MAQGVHTEKAEVAYELRDKAKAAFLSFLKQWSEVEPSSIEESQCETKGGWTQYIVDYKLKSNQTTYKATFGTYESSLTIELYESGENPKFRMTSWEEA
jgi:hypothetical protein